MKVSNNIRTHATKHAQQRMSQRGLTRSMIDMVIALGKVEQDKYILDRKLAEEALLQLKKIIDKGGATVVMDDDVIITTYNCNTH